MIHCAKCGAENQDDARFCVSCGASLYAERRRARRGDDCFGSREGDECFGLPHGGKIAGIVFGLFIIIVGVALILGEDITSLIGPFILIVLGLLIVAGALYWFSRRGGTYGT